MMSRLIIENIVCLRIARIEAFGGAIAEEAVRWRKPPFQSQQIMHVGKISFLDRHVLCVRLGFPPLIPNTSSTTPYMSPLHMQGFRHFDLGEISMSIVTLPGYGNSALLSLDRR